jgi:hypothetical protein
LPISFSGDRAIAERLRPNRAGLLSALQIRRCVFERRLMIRAFFFAYLEAGDLDVDVKGEI